MSSDTVTNKKPKSIVIKVSISNREDSNGDKKKSLYNRLNRYAKDKGVKETDIMRFALSMLLDKAGY